MGIRFHRWSMCAALALIACLISPAFSQASQQRLLAPDDLFKLEEVGQVSLSPDGQWLAYVVKRPKTTARIHTQQLLNGNDRGDIWLVSTVAGKPQNLTHGEVDSSGYWAPTWSPSGERLAMLSTKGGIVGLWMWEKTSGRLKQLTERSVDQFTLQTPFLWLSDQHLVCPVLPEGQKPWMMNSEMGAAEMAMRKWPKAWQGREPTASLLESGNRLQPGQRPQGQLLLIDALKMSQSIAAAMRFIDLRLSPDQQHIAALKQVDVAQPDPNRPLTQLNGQVLQAAVFDRRGAPALPEVAKVNDVQLGSLRWSPDGAALALIGKVSGASTEHPQVVMCELASASCRAVTSDEIEPRAISWSAKRNLLILQRPKPGTMGRTDWWAIDPDGKKRNLTAKMKAVPGGLISEAGGGSVVGLANGDLWRVRLDSGEAQNLTADFEPRVASIIWPNQTAEVANGVTQLILGVRQEAQMNLYRFDLGSGQVTALSKPHAEATLVDFAPQHQTAIFTANDRTGTFLWLSHPAFEQFTKVVETNTFLREIAQGELKQIVYRSLDGQDLKGWVVLPINYQEGKRYPLVVWVYAGLVLGEAPLAQEAQIYINKAHPLNLQLLAARGYAVLFPSMPLKPNGEPSDPYLELTKGVLPAVDKVIELGIADPKRLGVMGQSYGGYTTYGLVTQTNRFQAAVSLAGFADLVSLYGTFDPRLRYSEFPHEELFRMSIAEAGQNRMGNPPWKDLGRYLRNSPLFYAERVETPLMIVQGDMDFVAMQQGEEFFTALYRQNKRAAFVRYWGEGHVLASPANIRDLWERIYGWFDQFLKPGNESAGGAQTGRN